MVAATTLFATLDAVIKWLMADYHVVQVMFFRSAFALVPLVPLVVRQGPRVLATRRPLAHGLRSLVGVVAVASFFIAFGELPLAQVIAVSFAAPLIMTALSGPVLGEAVEARRWVAVAVGFVGVLMIVRPDAATPSAGMMAALVGTVLYAVVMVMMRDLGRTEPSVTTVFWFTLTCTVVTGLLLPWHWRAPGWGDLALFAASGIVGGTAQLLATQALRLAPVAVVASFDYLHLVFSVALGWAVWGDLPTAWTLAGAAVIALCGLVVVRMEASSPTLPAANPTTPDSGRGR